MSSIIEESGGDPFIEDSGKISQGILQWKKDRYKVGEEKDAYKELDNQLAYILSSIHNLTDGYSWTHGGKGSGYMKAKDAYADFVNGKDDLQKVNHGFVWGYVRPGGKADSEANRLRVATDIYNLLWK